MPILIKLLIISVNVDKNMKVLRLLKYTGVDQDDGIQRGINPGVALHGDMWFLNSS